MPWPLFLLLLSSASNKFGRPRSVTVNSPSLKAALQVSPTMATTVADARDIVTCDV